MSIFNDLEADYAGSPEPEGLCEEDINFINTIVGVASLAPVEFMNSEISMEDVSQEEYVWPLGNGYDDITW